MRLAQQAGAARGSGGGGRKPPRTKPPASPRRAAGRRAAIRSSAFFGGILRWIWRVALGRSAGAWRPSARSVVGSASRCTSTRSCRRSPTCSTDARAGRSPCWTATARSSPGGARPSAGRSTRRHVSPNLRNAVVATEDKRFYWHFGISPRGIASAIRINLAEGRGPLEGNGGSTITQQVAKLLCLGVPYDPSQWKSEADYEADCRQRRHLAQAQGNALRHGDGGEVFQGTRS